MAKLYTQKEMKWSDADIDMLGILVSNNETQSNSQYDSCINKMQLVINQWSSRTLPLTGKVLLINTLMGSLFVYTMMILPPLSKQHIEKIDTMIIKFLWGKKKSKVPLKILRRPKSSGGLKLVDFEIKYQSLQTKWITKALFDQEFRYANEILSQDIGAQIWYCNINEKDAKKLVTVKSF